MGDLLTAPNEFQPRSIQASPKVMALTAVKAKRFLNTTHGSTTYTDVWRSMLHETLVHNKFLKDYSLVDHEQFSSIFHKYENSRSDEVDYSENKSVYIPLPEATIETSVVRLPSTQSAYNALMTTYALSASSVSLELGRPPLSQGMKSHQHIMSNALTMATHNRLAFDTAASLAMLSSHNGKRRDFAVSGSLLGASFVLFSIGMSVPWMFSSFYLIHPAIALGLLITGITFIAMSRANG